VTHTARADDARGVHVAPSTVVVMVGAPGAGKGTQAQRLAQGLDLISISTGDLFRAALREGTALGSEVRKYVEKGTLVPDQVTLRVVEERLAQPDAAHGVVLDGFPRTRVQAEGLDVMLAHDQSRVSAALYIEVEAPELVRRLAGRRVCSGTGQHVFHLDSRPPTVEGICDVDGTPLVQRNDDRPETIRARLARQLPPMYEVVDHYQSTGVLHAVRGDRPMDEITQELLRLAQRASRKA
jgi:adenylate kinase